MTRVDPPDRVKWSDTILDWIGTYRHRWEKHVAKVEAQRANTIWELEYVAQLATTMVNAPQRDRERCATEIRHVMVAGGYWKGDADA